MKKIIYLIAIIFCTQFAKAQTSEANSNQSGIFTGVIISKSSDRVSLRTKPAACSNRNVNSQGVTFDESTIIEASIPENIEISIGDEVLVLITLSEAKVLLKQDEYVRASGF